MTLSELIDRVEKLDGPSRDADDAIHVITNKPLRAGLRFGAIPAYTASLDAAIALTERALPDANRTIRKRFRTTEGRIDGHKFDAQVTGGDVCEGFNEATALVLATLRSLSAQERDDGR